MHDATLIPHGDRCFEIALSEMGEPFLSVCPYWKQPDKCTKLNRADSDQAFYLEDYVKECGINLDLEGFPIIPINLKRR